jgi:uncharacterized protein YjiS (DUF1127 family)
METIMRHYILSQAEARDSLSLPSLVRRMIRNWNAQKDLRKLLEMDSYLLQDMGLTRALVQHLAAQSLTVDLDWERERVLRVR